MGNRKIKKIWLGMFTSSGGGYVLTIAKISAKMMCHQALIFATCILLVVKVQLTNTQIPLQIRRL